MRVRKVFLFRHLPTVSDDDPLRGTLLSGPELVHEDLSPHVGPVRSWLQSAISGRPFSVLRRDDSLRCVETARAIAAAVGCHDVRLSEALRPRHWGAWAGRPWSDVAEYLGGLKKTDRRKFRPPGGESWHQLDSRVRPVLWHSIDVGEGNIGFVSHMSTIRAMLACMIGPEDSLKVSLDPGGFIEIEPVEEGGWAIVGDGIRNPPKPSGP